MQLLRSQKTRVSIMVVMLQLASENKTFFKLPGLREVSEMLGGFLIIVMFLIDRNRLIRLKNKVKILKSRLSSLRDDYN